MYRKIKIGPYRIQATGSDFVLMSFRVRKPEAYVPIGRLRGQMLRMAISKISPGSVTMWSA